MDSKIAGISINPDKHIIPSPLEITKDDEIEASRCRALLCSSPELIHKMNSSEILVLQEVLQHGHAFGRWVTPRKWQNTQGGRATLNIDIRGRIQNFLPAELQAFLKQDNAPKSAQSNFERLNQLIDLAVLIETRYLILLRIGPTALGKKGRARSLDPTSVKSIAYSYMAHVLGICVGKAFKRQSFFAETGPQPQKMLALLEQSDFEGMSTAAKNGTLLEVRRMHRLSQHGCWSDVPSVGRQLDVVTHVRGDSPKRLNERKVDAHLPLPDAYVSEMGVKSLWLINHLGPNLLTLGEQISVIWGKTDQPGISEEAIRLRRKSLVTTLLQNHHWCDATGQSFLEPPFKISLTLHGKLSQQHKNSSKAGPNLSWPPCTFGELMSLMGNLQLAHLFVVCMSTAGRKSEAIDLSRDCVRYERNDMPYVSGRTFKLVERHEGEFRDWVLPVAATEAIEQQVRLVRIMERIGTMKPSRTHAPVREEPRHLWAQYGVGKSDRTAPLLGLNQAFRAYAKTLGMDVMPGGQSFRIHRFRKTIARLVALAITQAPKVLMDVFGHRSIEMTLYYILTDKNLRADIEKVSRELRILKATQTIEDIIAKEDDDTANWYGGPAAKTLKKAIESKKARIHQMGERLGRVRCC